jgi:hypothetical protein
MEILVLPPQSLVREDQLQQIRVWGEPEEEALPVQEGQVVLTVEVTVDLQQVMEQAEEAVQGMLLLQVQAMAAMAVILPQAQQVRVHYLAAWVAQTEQVMEVDMPVLLRVEEAVVAVSLFLMDLNPVEPVLQER